MKFVLISDVHIDLNRWRWECLNNTPSDVNTIVVAGDISNDIWITSDWLVDLKTRFENVIWVAGNHDFYNSGFHRTRMVDPVFEKEWPYPKTVVEMYDHYSRWSLKNNIHFLHRNSVTIDGVVFIGATGWHDYVGGEPYSTEDQIDTWYHRISDRHIYWTDDMKADHMNPYNAGIEDVAAISNMVESTGKNMVVITHHIPHRDFLWQKPEDPIWTQLHGSFVNTKLESISNSEIKYWIYGHTHQRGMADIGGTTYVCNAKGYRGENPSWTPIILEV